MTRIIEDKNAYPYITEFKKEAFKSFALVEEREIKPFYISKYNEIIRFYRFFNENLLNERTLNLENLYWFLLLRKYLKEDKRENHKEIYNFIKKCEISRGDKLGFKFSINSNQKDPDIWSTYFALASLNLLGLLKEFLISQGQHLVKSAIKNFVLDHNKKNSFLHCLDKDCEICNKTSPARNAYFALEIFKLLDVDTRLSKDLFRSYLIDIKREPSIIFKLLCFKFLDLESNVKDRDIQYLLQFQKENGGFSFKKINGGINTSFWVVYTLDNYSWLLDYNPIGIYSFINSALNEILCKESDGTLIKLMEVSKLIILLSIIWKKFISEIERIIFKQIEQEKYIDLNQIKTNFGLTYGIEEVISFINLNYNLELKILDSKIEFRNYLRNLNKREELIASILYEQLSKNNIISLRDIIKKYNLKYKFEPIKVKDVRILLREMIKRNFFKGKIKSKKKFLGKTKYYFYLDFFLEKIIVSDIDINTERLYNEKEKLKEIKNDIFNMTLKLKRTPLQIKEEIKSYLILDEIDYAKLRLKYLLRDALMEANFFNENIENSFNLDLNYVNIQSIFKSEIALWKKLYSFLNNQLKELDIFLKKKIEEKGELRNLNRTLDNMEDKIFIFNESINKKIDEFREFLRETSEKYSDEGFSRIIQEFKKIKTNVNDFNKKIYEISQKIYTKEENINQKRKKVINNWVTLYEELNNIFDYYSNGFDFFKEILNKINFLKNDIIQNINAVNEKTQIKVKEKKFKEAFEIIKAKSDTLLKEKIKQIKDLQKNVLKEINSKQKLYLLYRHLIEKLEVVEENLVSVIQEQEQSLKNKIIEKRNITTIKEFDNFVSEEISEFKNELNNYKKRVIQVANKRIKEVIKGLNDIRNKFNKANKLYLKKLNNCKELIINFDEKSNITILQWDNFKEYFNHEISILKDDYINKIITEKIYLILDEKKTNRIKIIELKKELDLKCESIITRIKEMIEISKLNAKLYEDEKCVLIFTEHYYKNKELRNFIDNNILKFMRETVGKILALYDSSIRNRTLNVNMLELQNRISDLNFEETVEVQFFKKAKDLQIQIESRGDYIKTKNYFDSVIENNKLAINSIKKNLDLFTNKQTFINKEFNNLKMRLEKKSSEVLEELDKSQEEFSYLKIKENIEHNWRKLANEFEQTQRNIDDELKTSLNQINKSFKLSPELGEYFVKKKNAFIKEFREKKEKINNKILRLKDDALRGKLITFINKQKICISQMLGTLQAKVEDNVEIKEFKRAYYKVRKKFLDIQSQIKLINRDIKNLVKEFNKHSNNFAAKSKYILEDFNKFIDEFLAVLSEKVKTLERLILKSYIEMAIKAVANEFLTVSFLNDELKIKKKNIQDHLIYLISSGELKGKYDPRFGIYYENSEILDNLDEEELEVIKKMNFKVYMFIRRLKTFASQYGSIIGFFASLLAITYYIFVFSGGNPAVFAFPISIILVLIFYFFFKRSKEEKFKV
ncbi:MAG: hypothetical protein ACFFAN_07625 [Promethearchaeota archaeon]